MDSRVEWLLEALLNGESIENFEPRSRLESYLEAVIEKTGVDNLEIPRSRLDALLYELADKAPEDYANAIEEGKEAKRRAFWASLTNNGATRAYLATFGAGWTNDCFDPCFDIKPSNAFNMFRDTRMGGDLAQKLEDLGVKLDFSGNFNFDSTFYNTNFSRLPEISMLKGNLSTTFYYSTSLVTIDKIITTEERTYGGNNTFKCVNLKDIRFEGTIGHSINFPECSKLTVDSAKDIIAHLKNYLGTDNDQTCTLKFHETVWTNLEASGAAPDGNTWKEYVQYTLGWKI